MAVSWPRGWTVNWPGIACADTPWAGPEGSLVIVSERRVVGPHGPASRKVTPPVLGLEIFGAVAGQPQDVARSRVVAPRAAVLSRFVKLLEPSLYHSLVVRFHPVCWDMGPSALLSAVALPQNLVSNAHRCVSGSRVMLELGKPFVVFEPPFSLQRWS